MSDGIFDGQGGARGDLAEGLGAKLLGTQKEISGLKKREETLFAEVGRQAFSANPAGYAQGDGLRLIQSDIRDAEEKLNTLQREAEEAQRAKKEAESATRCPSCGNQNPEGTKFCRGCGAKLGASPKAFCTACGTELLAGARFCGSCGAQQSGNYVQTAVPTSASNTAPSVGLLLTGLLLGGGRHRRRLRRRW
jgi:hypothetical protein